VQRLGGLPLVSHAVAAGEVVISCAYPGYVPEAVLRQLPAGFAARSYVARFEGGKLVAVVAGNPEEVIANLLPRAEPPMLAAP
jgi:hypothetical protein